MDLNKRPSTFYQKEPLDRAEIKRERQNLEKEGTFFVKKTFSTNVISELEKYFL